MLITIHRSIFISLTLAATLFSGTATANNAVGPHPDYGLLDGVLLRSVRNGFVDYDSIQSDPAFARFIEQIGAASKASLQEPNDRLAFYINAYNALAIQGILKGLSPDSAMGRFRFFRSARYTVHGEKMNLSELEKKNLAAQQDPRIHFAIVCASISCPRLSNRAYQPETLDEDLSAAAARFINDTSRNRFDLKRKTAYLSRIFQWYRSDFASVGGSLQTYLAAFVSDPDIAAALNRGDFHLEFDDYDWSLNGYFSHAR